MQDEPYEKAYQDARELLVLRGKSLGQPTHRAGVRYCAFEGLLLSDREMLSQAWNEEVAEAIIEECATLARHVESASSSPSCAECDRFFLKYSAASETYLEILRLRAETGNFRLWLSGEIIDANAGRRDAAREALTDHKKAHARLAVAASVATK